jgi:hypothetical protein
MVGENPAQRPAQKVSQRAAEDRLFVIVVCHVQNVIALLLRLRIETGVSTDAV